MKRFIFLISVLLTQVASASDLQNAVNKMSEIVYGRSLANAKLTGTINGGGGVGVSCGNAPQQAISLLDIYEQDRLWGLAARSDDPQNEDEALDLLAKLTADHFWNPWTVRKEEMIIKIKEVYREYLRAVQFLPAGSDLATSDDAYSPILDPNCHFVQIALFYNESKLLIDSELWAALNWRDRAALLGHEVIYQLARMNGETDSINTRKFISYLFSKQGLSPLAKGAPLDRNQVVTCVASQEPGDSTQAVFFGYETSHPDGYKQMEFVSTLLNGKATIFRTTFVMPVAFADFFDLSNHFGLEADLKIDTFPYQRNSIYVYFTELSPEGVLKGMFNTANQNGTVTGGPWPIRCLNNSVLD